MMALTQKDEDIADDATVEATTKEDKASPNKRSLPKVRSGSNMAALVEEQKIGDLKQKEDQFKAAIGPQ